MDTLNVASLPRTHKLRVLAYNALVTLAYRQPLPADSLHPHSYRALWSRPVDRRDYALMLESALLDLGVTVDVHAPTHVSLPGTPGDVTATVHAMQCDKGEWRITVMRNGRIERQCTVADTHSAARYMTAFHA